MDIQRGEIVGIVGPNGSGKTTLLNILTMNLKRTAGIIEYWGKSIDELTTIEGAGVVFQHNKVLWPNYTVVQNLKFYGSFKANGNLDDKINELLEVLNLYPFKDILSRYLSGGNKRKLQIAIALLHDPILIFFDEATTGLDPLSRRKFYQYLKKYGTTALIVTQSLDDVEEYCDKVAIMIKGTLVELCTVNHLLLKY